MSKHKNVQESRHPLSREQHKIWFQYSLLPQLPVYNIAEMFHVRGALDMAVFVRALQHVVARHDGMAVRFDEEDGKVVQVIDGSAIPASDLVRVHTGVDSLDKAIALIGECSLEPFDLLASFPVRVDIAQFDTEDYVIGFCTHHIAYDGWSSAIFFDELDTTYRDFSNGVMTQSKERAKSYLDYVKWQGEEEQQHEVRQHNQYWHAYLQGVPPRLELAVKRRRERNFNYLGQCQVIPIPAGLYEAVNLLARQQRVTAFSVYMTVFSILLQRYSREPDFCIGYPSANRGMPDAETIIGMFTNTLVFRAQFDPEDRFVDALARTHETMLNAQDNERVQFENVLEELKVTRDGSYNPLFQVILAAQDRRDGGLRLQGASVAPLMNPITTAKLDLSVMIDVDDLGARGIIEYATSVFDASEIERLWQYFLQMLLDFSRNPELQLHSPVLEGSAPAPMPPARVADEADGMLIHSWFAQVARTFPQMIAVECGDDILTYAELNAQSDQLSQRLLQRGARTGELIGLSLPRDTKLIIAILAILKAGCGYLPLDPNYPIERLNYMVEDAGCKLVIVASSASSPISADSAGLVALDEEDASDGAVPVPVGEITAESIGYCIYTSGSTGKPKGVLISHRNVARLFRKTEHWFNFDQHDVWTMFHSYSFDFSVWEIFGALLYGGKLLVLPYEITRSPEDFRQLLKQKRVTVLNQTPSAFQQISHVEVGERSPADRLDSLRYVIFGGEALNLQSLSQWASRYGDDHPKLINMYGITETTVHVTYRRILLGDITSQTGSLIGEPIPDLFLHLFDEAGNAVPSGVIGEIYVGGDGVAIGYHRRETLNLERFISWQAPDGRTHRLYRTGDLARRHADGEMEYVGRIDHQVKVRGHRIEIGEIEAQLLQSKDVAQATVLVKTTTSGPEILIAWIVAVQGRVLDPMQIKRSLATVLPAFMIPHEIVVIERMPLTQNGKIATAELLAAALPARPREQHYVAPQTPRQRQLLAAWEQVLQVDRIGIHDNFFAIGGDSIRAVMVAQRCKEQGILISVIDLLNHQTVYELAERSAIHARSVDVLAGARPVSAELSPARAALFARLDVRDPVYPVSGMQAVMFQRYLQYAGDGQGIYHVQQSYRFSDEHPDSGAMETAIARMIAAHPVLRTVVLCTDEGEWLQCILPKAVVRFSVCDLRATDRDERERRIAAFAQHDKCQPFMHNDLSSSLLRFTWFQLSDTEFELFMSAHHGIDDGWGNQMFLSRLFELYLSARTGSQPSVALQDNVLLEYISLEKENMQDPAHAAYWAAQAAGTNWDRRPMLTARPGSHNAPVERLLTRSVTARLEQIARQRQVTFKALLISVLQETLLRWSITPSRAIGIVMNGRKETLSDPLHSLGLFWNMLPLTGNCGDFDERLQANHRELLEMEKFSAYPADRTGVVDGVSHEPQVTFNYVNFHNHTAYGGNAMLRLLREYNHDKFHYPLNVFASFERERGELYLKVESDASFFSAATVLEMVDAYVAHLTAQSAVLASREIA